MLRSYTQKQNKSISTLKLRQEEREKNRNFIFGNTCCAISLFVSTLNSTYFVQFDFSQLHRIDNFCDSYHKTNTHRNPNSENREMSFADLEAGRPLPSIRRQQQQQHQDPSQAVASGIFQINTAVSSFHRLVNSLGTPKDTLDLRDRLHKTRLHIGQLVKETSAKLKEASETDLRFEVGASKKIADAKLARDFQAVLKEFQKAQRLAAQRETAYSPFVPKEAPSSGSFGDDEEISSSQRQEQQALLLESRKEEVVLLDNELVFNEAVIEEREHGIQEIQHQIGEVNEIFKDLAVLVHDQGVVIDDISSNIESSQAATTQGATQLVKAAKSQKSSSSLVCLLLVIFGIILLIVIIIVVF